MNKYLNLIFVLIFLNCSSQNIKKIDLTHNKEFNYSLANLYLKNTKKIDLENFHVTIFEQSDPLHSPDDNSEGDETLISLIISVVNDGEYANSKLYKLEGLVNPKIVSVKAIDNYSKFVVEIEHGKYNNRQTESQEFDAVK